MKKMCFYDVPSYYACSTSCDRNDRNMGKQKDLTQEEKKNIVQGLAQGKKSIKISKELCSDHRTVKRFIANSHKARKGCDKGVFRSISRRQLSTIKREVARHPLSTSKQSFEDAEIQGIPRISRCRILKSVAKAVKPNIRPPLTNRHKIQQVEWAKRHIKTDFQTVFFTDECRATLEAWMVGAKGGWLMVPKSQQD